MYGYHASFAGLNISMQSANAERRREKSIMTVAAGPSLHTLTSGEVEIGVSADTAGWRRLILLEVNVVSDSLTKWSIRSTS